MAIVDDVSDVVPLKTLLVMNTTREFAHHFIHDYAVFMIITVCCFPMHGLPQFDERMLQICLPQHVLSFLVTLGAHCPG